jgi:hypothetical protein
MSETIVAAAEYNELLDSIKQTLAAGQLRATRAVNNVLVETYWQIGREIVRRQREQGWGSKVIERLSADLRTARPPACADYQSVTFATWPRSPPGGQPKLCRAALHNCPGAW